MTSAELIAKYLEYFRQRGHAVIATAPLVPENDPTVLFTTAGMHPLVPYLLGQPHPAGKRLANVQPCLRTTDIDAVGDATHDTFFEMLGNWSLGDYFKDEAIRWSWEFLTAPRWLNIPPERLAVSIFAGDSDAPRDDESAAIWQSLGVRTGRIAALPKANNWWGPAGLTGPCGPDTEMFYWNSVQRPPMRFDPDDARWVEIWNDVFMQYRKTEAGTFTPLEQKNVDTGMGVERTVMVLNGLPSIFAIDTLAPAMALLRQLAQPSAAERPLRIVADHLRAATMILGDANPVTPSNVERGYILRRLIRRAMRHARSLGIASPFTARIANEYVALYTPRYPQLSAHADFIARELRQEEERFTQTLERGEREVKRLMQKLSRGRRRHRLPGQEAFDLFQTYGFPLELTEEVLREHGWEVDREDFARALKNHQDLSRTAAAGQFRSGLADTSAATTRLHTATHLLHAALRQVLGTHVQQKGSNITPQRLRFDFSHPSKLTAQQLQLVEALVNQQVQRALPVLREEMTPAEAKQRGALGFFDHKYAGKIFVYRIGDFSQEICTGPHVGNTREVGQFTITREEALGSGVRRIRAVVHPSSTGGAQGT